MIIDKLFMNTHSIYKGIEADLGKPLQIVGESPCIYHIYSPPLCINEH